MPDHPTTSAERLRHYELPPEGTPTSGGGGGGEVYAYGRADADIAPTQGERYFPIHAPLPDDLDMRPGAMNPLDVVGAATAVPTSALARKELPLATGLLDYFPAALVAVAGLSRVGNEQHNPGKPMHWDRSKSGDEADALMRHLVERGTIDTDGLRHSTKVAWRALALLQKELEEAGLAPLSRGSR